MKYGRIVCVACIVALAGIAYGEILFDNGQPNYESGWAADFDDFQEDADNFVLSTGANRITDFHWWGVYAYTDTPETDDFTIRIYADAGGDPAMTRTIEWTNLDVTRTWVGTITNAFDLYAYDVEIPTLYLAPNTTYWLSILNDTHSDIDDDWFWAEAVESGGNAHFRRYDDGSWLNMGNEMAFYITGIVPEPASLTLMGVALAVLAAGSRRRAS